MNRKTFIKAGCLACTSIGFLGTILESCTSVKYASADMAENGLLLGLDQFKLPKTGYRSYVILRNEELKYPICVYRIDETQYSAVLMRCTHQGAELLVAGDHLTCPAHGSEFTKWGKVVQAPAATDLRSFPVSVINDKLFIDLRKQK